MGHFIGERINTQHEGECGGVVQVLRHKVFAQHQAVKIAGQGSGNETDQQGFAKNIQGMTEHVALAPGDNALEHQNGQQGAHRVDDDAFPAQNIGQFGARAH